MKIARTMMTMSRKHANQDEDRMPLLRGRRARRHGAKQQRQVGRQQIGLSLLQMERGF